MPVDLQKDSHRPWPLPSRRPAMGMQWHDLLFAHWPVPLVELQKLVPAGLTLDTFEGEAYIGVVPFLMTGVRVHLLPGLPGSQAFPEINVRTYICQDDKPGVYFFSLDAASWIAVKAARAWYHLPYFHARISSVRSQIKGDETITYSSERYTETGGATAEFQGSYTPIGEPSLGQSGSLAHWLTERYCLYASHRGRTYRADIHHEMWPLQQAEAEITRNTMTAALGLTLPDTPPLLHFARHLEVVAWAPQQI